MRRVTKKILILVIGIIIIGFYCEFLVYYIIAVQCSWPKLNASNVNVLKAFILADTHLLGPYRGHWLDKWRREWQMHQAFQAIIKLHRPEAVFVLGDLFDEGEWTDDEQFNEYVDRFHKLFSLPDDIKMFVAVGNHDIGFHNFIRQDVALRFTKLLKAPSVQHVILKDNHFVILNSMAMQGDSCRLCTGARRQIEKLSEKLSKCSEDVNQCYRENKKFNYSQPILMQHFPLYRVSDSICTEPDAPPLPARNKLFRIKLDALSQESTKYIISKIKPRVVFGGHTHHGCLVQHRYDNLGGLKFLEYSVPSFSWRNRLDPKYMLNLETQVLTPDELGLIGFKNYLHQITDHLVVIYNGLNLSGIYKGEQSCFYTLALDQQVSISPAEYAVNKCGLPRETTIILSAVIMICILFVYVLRKGRRSYIL